MFIANPILDNVIKYLLENLEVAIGLFACIIGLDTIPLVLKSTEFAYEILLISFTKLKGLIRY